MPLRIACAPLEDHALENGVKEDFEIVAALSEKKKKKKKSQKEGDWNNNDLQVGCIITNNFPCAHEETAGWVLETFS